MQIIITPDTCHGTIHDKVFDVEQITFEQGINTLDGFAITIHFTAKKANDTDILEIPLTVREAKFLAASMLSMIDSIEKSF